MTPEDITKLARKFGAFFGCELMFRGRPYTVKRLEMRRDVTGDRLEVILAQSDKAKLLRLDFMKFYDEWVEG